MPRRKVTSSTTASSGQLRLGLCATQAHKTNIPELWVTHVGHNSHSHYLHLLGNAVKF